MSDAPKTLEEGLLLKEKARREKSLFIAGLSPEALVEFERLHKASFKKEDVKKMSIRRYEGFDKDL